MCPRTFVIMLVVGVCLVVGALALSLGHRPRKTNTTCKSCGWENPPPARFCARCGRALDRPGR